VRKQIVHNIHVVRDLEARGAIFVEEETEVPQGATLVYSAHGNVVDTVICDGQVLMKGRKVPGEAEIVRKAADVGRDLVARE